MVTVDADADADAGAHALADVDALGGFFALRTGPAEAVDPSWRPLTTLTALAAGSASPDGPLPRRIDEVAAQLGDAPRRVAASLLSLSLTARVVSIVLGAAAMHRLLPRLPHTALHWRPWSGGPMPLWIETPHVDALGPPEHPDTACRVAEELATQHLHPLLDAVAVAASVPPTTLWGNAASSLGGAVRILVTERPEQRYAVEAMARGVLRLPPLAGLGEFVDEPSHPTGLAFVRRSCCLFYRLPGGGLCEDCVLAHR